MYMSVSGPFIFNSHDIHSAREFTPTLPTRLNQDHYFKIGDKHYSAQVLTNIFENEGLKFISPQQKRDFIDALSKYGGGRAWGTIKESIERVFTAMLSHPHLRGKTDFEIRSISDQRITYTEKSADGSPIEKHCHFKSPTDETKTIQYHVDCIKLLAQSAGLTPPNSPSSLSEHPSISSGRLAEETLHEPGRLAEEILHEDVSPLRSIEQTVDDSVMTEYNRLNPSNPGNSRLRNKLIFIQAAIQLGTDAIPLINSLKLTPAEVNTCLTLAKISKSVQKVKGFPPRPNQLLSVLHFLEGKQTGLAQIGTGQGKTLIAAMTAIARVKLYNERVCVLTTTEPLAVSGVGEMEALYADSGICVAPFTGQRSAADMESVDVYYTTSFALESDKVAKKVFNGRQQLPLWSTPFETLLSIAEGYKTTNPSLVSDLLTLLETYRESPTLENEMLIKHKILELKTTDPDLNRIHRPLGIIVDECDSVLYDHAGARIQSTIPMPYADTIKEIGEGIAKNVSEYYGSEAPTSPEEFKRTLSHDLKTRITSQATMDPFLKEYLQGEIDDWIDDAIKVLKPDDLQWRDGVNYLKAPSLARDLNQLFIKIGKEYESLPRPIQSQLTSVLTEGLDLNDRLTKVQTDAHTKDCLKLSQELIAYFPELITVISTPPAQELFRQPQFRGFIDSLSEMFSRIRNLNSKLHEGGFTETQARELLVNDQIRYIEEGTSQIIEKMKFANLVQLFLEYKEYGKGFTVASPTTALNLQSQLDVFADADTIVGFTGSLPRSETYPAEYAHFKTLIERVYSRGSEAVKLRAIPDFTESKKRVEETILCEDIDTWHAQILSEIENKRHSQAILIVCKNPESAQHMKDFLNPADDRSLSPCGLYVKNQDEAVINAKYKAGDIVVTTALGARGTDWHVTAAKGFHVLCTYKPVDARTETQISGRAARSGQEGSYREISLVEDGSLARNKIDSIKSSINQACYNDLFSTFYRLFKSSIGKNEPKQQQLILWLSRSAIKKEVYEALRAKIERGDNSLLNAFFTTFTTTFTLSPEEVEGLLPKFQRAVTEWSSKTASWFS